MGLTAEPAASAPSGDSVSTASQGQTSPPSRQQPQVQVAGPAPTPRTKARFFEEIEDCTLTDREVDEVRELIWNHNEYEFVQTEVRNVMLCGRSRSGKTTAIGVLKDPCYFPKTNSIFADSAGTRFQTFSINNRADSKVEKYSINIIDTPGLFEVTAKDVQARPDEQILKTIAACLDHELTYLNVVVMFATFEAGINPHDILSMQKFLALFGESNVKIALCITRADAHNRAWREELVAQLRQQSDISRMIDAEQMSVIFMGCVDAKSAHYPSKDHLHRGYVSIYNMRKVLLELIFGASKRVQLKEMKLAQQKIAQLKDMLETSIAEMKALLKVTDFATQQYQQSLLTHRSNMEYIQENHSYVSVKELAPLLGELDAVAREIQASATIPADDKANIVWPLQL